MDEDDHTCWTNHEEIRGLYVEDVVQIDGSIDPVDYELVCLGNLQIDNIDTPSIMTIMHASSTAYWEPKGMILSVGNFFILTWNRCLLQNFYYMNAHVS